MNLVSDERLRRQATNEGSIVMIVAPTPRIVEGQLEVAFIVINQQGTLFNGDEVYEAVLSNEDQLVEAVSKICHVTAIRRYEK